MLYVVHCVYKHFVHFTSLVQYFVIVTVYICVYIYIKYFVVSHSGYLNWRRVCRLIRFVSSSFFVSWSLLFFTVVTAIIVMAACVFGSVEAFNVKTDKWELWEEKFKFFLLANSIKDDAKKPMLLATVGMTALGYLHDLNMPTSLDDAGVTYTRLLEQFRAHFGAKTTQLAARHEFGRLLQKDSESVDDYAASLRTASVLCGFCADLDIRLRDQLLLGLKSEAI